MIGKEQGPRMPARSPESRDIAVIAEIGKTKTLSLMNADHADRGRVRVIGVVNRNSSLAPKEKVEA